MNQKPIVILSIGLNLALLGTVGWLIKNRPNTAIGHTLTNAPATAAPEKQRPGKETATTTSAEPAKAMQSFDWRLVESGDYKKYIANLRAIGCPEETIRDIIMADVTNLFASRKKALS